MFADKNSYDEEKLYQYQKIDNDMNETMAAIERCVKANPDLKGILITSDIEALLASAILENHPVIKVPSFESIFLQKHKYYSRMNESNPIKCQCIDVFDDVNLTVFGPVTPASPPRWPRTASSQRGV